MTGMKEAERRRFLNTLRADDDFRTTVRRELLTEDVLNMPQTVATLVDVVAQQRQDFTALATDLHRYMDRTLTVVGEGFTAMGQGFRTVDERFRTTGEDMQSGFAAVDAKFDQVCADIRDIKDHLPRSVIQGSSAPNFSPG
jgi:hypothetical protein